MNKLDNIFKSKLADFERTLPQDDWERFLQRQNAVKNSPDKAVALIPFTLAGAAIACLCAILVIGPEKIHPQKTAGPSIPTSPAPTPQAHSQTIVLSKKIVSNGADNEPGNKILYANNTVLADDPEPTPGIQPKQPDRQKQKEQDEPSKQDLQTEHTERMIPEDWNESESSVSYTPRKKKRLVVPIISATVCAPFVACSAFPKYTSGSHSDDYLSNKTEGQTGPTKYGSDFTASKHLIPFMVGASIRYYFSDKWSITSGLEYSLYSSNFTSTALGSYKQVVHCLGVPIRADFTFSRFGRFEAYAGAGFKFDWNVSSRINGQAASSKAFVFGAVASIGIQYDITTQLGIYLEPQLSYPLLGKDSHTTFRTKNKLTPSACLGFRFSIK